MNAVAELLADLVAIPSMNPMGRSRNGMSNASPLFGGEYSEQNLADYLASCLRRHHIDVEIQACATRLEGESHIMRPNVLGRIDVNAPRTLLLDAHMDTVQAENMPTPFTPVVKEGKLYGRGACDTKGSIAAFLSAVTETLRNNQFTWNVLLLFTSDEEYGFTGAREAMQRRLKADAGITGEPTQLRIIRAHKGVVRWHIRTRGVAAHAAYPERGENAIYTMASVVSRLQRYAEELLHLTPHPVLGTPTLSVGVIEGGEAVNVVPASCRIEIDRRSLPGETTESILQPVHALLRDLPAVDDEPPYLVAAGMEVAEHAEVVRRLSEAIHSVTGDVNIEPASYATNAGTFNAAGIPTVVFGPGNIAQAHTNAEFIELNEVEQAAAIIKHLLTTH
ncbi:MAG: M20 family metallopeptidase [Bacteroidota bacterium]|nr:M20 family metallopeptidase [Bacteroidota bacterium]